MEKISIWILFMTIIIGLLSGCTEKEECWHYQGYSIHPEPSVQFIGTLLSMNYTENPQCIYEMTIELFNQGNESALFSVDFEFVSTTSAQTRNIRKQLYINANQTGVISVNSYND